MKIPHIDYFDKFVVLRKTSKNASTKNIIHNLNKKNFYNLNG